MKIPPAAVLLASCLLAAACGAPTVAADASEPGVCPQAICNIRVGTRSDGTVDLDAAAVWPNRQPEPAALSGNEHVAACATLAKCWLGPEDRTALFSLCVQPDVGFFWEERAVPTSNSAERWTYEARRVLEEKNDCEKVRSIKTERPQAVMCEEAGCWWVGAAPQVSCTGSVATLTTPSATATRDCARSFGLCDAKSPTGCTDRAPIGCERNAVDRCDGEVAIGCDSTGKVTFHDCGRVFGNAGGTCKVEGKSASCKAPEAGCKAGSVTCNDADYVVCLGTQTIKVPAEDVGASCGT